MARTGCNFSFCIYFTQFFIMVTSNDAKGIGEMKVIITAHALRYQACRSCLLQLPHAFTKFLYISYDKHLLRRTISPYYISNIFYQRTYQEMCTFSRPYKIYVLKELKPLDHDQHVAFRQWVFGFCHHTPKVLD